MSTELERQKSSDLVIASDQHGFTDRQKAALKQINVEWATESDLEVFFHQCKRSGLDPFSKQIYMISRRQKQGGEWVDKPTIQTAIDGYRLIAQRSSRERGVVFSMEDTLWADPNGAWHDAWIWPEPPAAAKVTVHVGDAVFSGVAATHEYMPMRMGRNGSRVPSGLWASMPAVMIAKCAEALALRKAFPQDLSGLYTAEEMDQADSSTHGTATIRQIRKPDAQPRIDFGRLRRAMTSANVEASTMIAFASDVLGRHIDSGAELSQADADAVAESLEEDLRRAKEDHPAGTGVDPETGEVTETTEEQK